MKSSHVNSIQKSKKSYRVARPSQTGFSSPATHYNEPRIDLNDVLVNNPSATFFIRVVGNSFSKYDIKENDVLIIDKSLSPKQNQLAIVIQEGEFNIIRALPPYETDTQLWGVITYIIKSVL